MKRIVIIVVLACACATAACSNTQQELAVKRTQDLEARVEALEKTVAAHDQAIARRKRNPATTTIVLSKSSSASGCDTAKVLDYRVGNGNERHVRWNIEDECNLGGSWRVELTFTEVGGKFPFANLTVRSRGNNRFIQERIKRNADAPEGVYNYKIYLVQGILPPRELADPELEVEPPPVRIQ